MCTRVLVQADGHTAGPVLTCGLVSGSQVCTAGVFCTDRRARVLGLKRFLKLRYVCFSARLLLCEVLRVSLRLGV